MNIFTPNGGGRRVTFIRPDDMHLHVRNGEMLHAVLPYTASVFGRAIIMPNLKQPVTTVKQAIEYREEILRAAPDGSNFEPLMTLYLTDNTSPKEILLAVKSGVVFAAKYYPAGATTNSDSGVTDLRKVFPVLEMMQREGMPLLVHGEVTDPTVDVFDREEVFIGRHLWTIIKTFPALKVVFEHVTTSVGVEFVKEAGVNVAATITAHHLHINRNNMLVGGIKPHNYCLPVAKREIHRLALVKAATSGNTKFFLGTDSAPHARTAKESDCGCAGCFTGPSAVELYLQAFDAAGKLENFEGFASFNGASFYGLPQNSETIAYETAPLWTPPSEISVGDNGEVVVPFSIEQRLRWKQVKE